MPPNLLYCNKNLEQNLITSIRAWKKDIKRGFHKTTLILETVSERCDSREEACGETNIATFDAANIISTFHITSSRPSSLTSTTLFASRTLIKTKVVFIVLIKNVFSD